MRAILAIAKVDKCTNENDERERKTTDNNEGSKANIL